MRADALVPSEQEAIDERITAEQCRELLEEQLARLSPAQREAIELCVVDELGYAECAQRSGVAEATIRQRTSRALRTMKTGIERTST